MDKEQEKIVDDVCNCLKKGDSRVIVGAIGATIALVIYELYNKHCPQIKNNSEKTA